MARKRIIKIVLVVLVALALSVASFFLWLSTASGQRYAQNLVRTQLSEAIGYQITADELRFAFPLRARIKHLSLADGEGEWLTADDISLSVLPTPIMHKRLVLQSLSAAGVNLLRLPHAEPKEESKPGGLDASVRAIDITAITLPESVTQLPESYSGNLTGALGWTAATQTLTLDAKSTMQRGLPGLEQAALSAKASLDLAKNTVTLTDISLEHPALKTTGQLTLDADRLSGSFATTLPGLAHWQPAAQGSATATTALSGTTTSPHIETTITATALQYNGTALPDTTARATADLNGQAVTGTLEATTADGGTLHTAYAYTAPTLTLSNLAATYLQATLNANLTMGTETQRADGKATLSIPEIKNFAAFLPIELSGKTDAIIDIAGLAATIHADASQLRTPYATIRSASAEARFPNLTALPDAIKLTAKGITRDSLTLHSLTLDATRKENDWQASIATSGSAPKAFNLATIATISPSAGATHVTLSALNGSYDTRPVRAATITAQLGEAIAVNVPSLTYGSGTYALSYNRDANDQLTATLKATNITPADFAANLPKEWKSARAGVHATWQGNASAPDAKADLTVTQLVLAPKAPPATLKATAAIEQGALTPSMLKLDATLTQGKTATSSLQLSMPATFTLTPVAFAIPDSAALSGKANLSMDVASWASLLLPAPHTLSGKLKADLAIAGSYARPALTGPIAFTAGHYTYPDLGIALENIAMHATAQNTTITLADLHAEDGKSHTINGKGTVSFPSREGLAYSAQLTAKDFILLRHPNARGQLSGELNLTGDANSGLIKGHLQNDRLDINLPERVIADMPQLNIVRTIPAKKKDKIKTQTPAPSLYTIALDILFKADNKVFVRGRGVDAELQGSIAIAGTAAKPDITGKLETIRGRYEEFGKQFTLTTAELLFVGDIPPSPFLNVVASIKEGATEIRPTLTGPALKPELKIESTPAMPQEEALSQLLFGQDSKKLSAFQAVQLANSVRQLSGHGGGGFDPIARVRKLIGVDDITIKNEANTDPSVGVGKYIGDKVYLQLEQGAAETSSKAKVEVEVNPSISVESGTTATGASSVGLNWKKDY